MKIPENVSLIIDRLEQNGFFAYVVGGCVRDTLMERIPYDWDITTNALPDEILDVFKGFKTIKTGIKHGTITVIIDHTPYEITTFRVDGEYLDSRHPESVNFVSSLYEDLKRRDFTINALAYNEKSGIIDYFGGIEDIKNKIIKCVGEPQKRFLEDALRIMRAIRFSSQLNFKIDPSTNDAILKYSHLLKNISKERIREEFSKMLLSDNSETIYEYWDVLRQFFNNSDCSENISLIKNLPKTIHLRLSALLFSLNFSKAENVIELLKSLRFDNVTIKKTNNVLLNQNIILTPEISHLRHLIKDIGYDVVYDLIIFKKFVFYNDPEKLETLDKISSLFDEIKLNKLCSTLQELKICGDDLISLGFKKGEIIGQVLNHLLTLVIDEKTENNKNILIKEAKKLIPKTEE